MSTKLHQTLLPLLDLELFAAVIMYLPFLDRGWNDSQLSALNMSPTCCWG